MIWTLAAIAAEGATDWFRPEALAGGSLVAAFTLFAIRMFVAETPYRGVVEDLRQSLEGARREIRELKEEFDEFRAQSAQREVALNEMVDLWRRRAYIAGWEPDYDAQG